MKSDSRRFLNWHMFWVVAWIPQRCTTKQESASAPALAEMRVSFGGHTDYSCRLPRSILMPPEIKARNSHICIITTGWISTQRLVPGSNKRQRSEMVTLYDDNRVCRDRYRQTDTHRKAASNLSSVQIFQWSHMTSQAYLRNSPYLTWKGKASYINK